MLVADRHHGLTESIRGLLETAFDAVMMLADANSLFEGAEQLQPALAVVDPSLFGNGGFKLLHTLQSCCPGLRINVLGMHDEPTLVRSVLEAGADDYVLKSAIGTDLLPAVEAVTAKGAKMGDARVNFIRTSDGIPAPTSAEESTRVY